MRLGERETSRRDDQNGRNNTRAFSCDVAHRDTRSPWPAAGTRQAQKSDVHSTSMDFPFVHKKARAVRLSLFVTTQPSQLLAQLLDYPFHTDYLHAIIYDRLSIDHPHFRRDCDPFIPYQEWVDTGGARATGALMGGAICGGIGAGIPDA